MECNVCGSDAKSVEITYRSITFKTAHCGDCGKARREISTTLATKEEISETIIVMHQLNAHGVNELRVAAIEYLERMLLKFSPERSLSQRRHDLWERRFLKEALQEDYYA